MLSLRGKQKKASTSANPEKELRRLSRQDLLELLLEQMREGDRLRGELQGMQGQNAEFNDLTDRLKARLDDKDAQIARLEARLNEKDALLKRMLDCAHGVVARRGSTREVSELEEIEHQLSQHFLGHAAQPKAVTSVATRANGTAMAQRLPNPEKSKHMGAAPEGGAL